MPRIVRTADRSTIKALGYRPVRITTTLGLLLLPEVWYTPDIHCRLVSTSILNDCGIMLVFEGRRLRAYQNQMLVFEGNSTNGLCYINQPAEQALATTLAEPAAGHTPALPAGQSERELLHYRLGHTNYRNVDKMLECATGVRFTKPRRADHCLAKQPVRAVWQEG